MTKLHLDVDGVLNAQIPTQAGWPDKDEGIAISDGWGWLIRWSPSMLKELAGFDLDLVWTTTWRDDAVTSIAPLIGWGDHGSVMHPVADSEYRRGYDHSIVWKYEAMQRMYSEQENRERFVWIDDEIEPHMIEWAEGVGGLAINTNPLTGISVADINLIKEYLDN
jgi:hypothetical protein